MSTKSLVVKDNALINSCYCLNLVEQRLLLLAISKSKQSEIKITSLNSLIIDVNEYASMFNIDKNSAYKILKNGCKQLFRREFSYKNNKGGITLSRWVSTIEYNDKEASISLIFSPKVIPFISELEKRFTSYFLKDISALNSAYAIRLYELIIAWKSTHKTPVFEIEDFRNKLGVNSDEYAKMSNFKSRVLNTAINQINEHSNIRIECEQHKKGRKIIGFSFSFIELMEEPKRDPNTIDWIDENKFKPKRERITLNEIVMRHPNETIGKSEPEIYKIFGNKYHII